MIFGADAQVSPTGRVVAEVVALWLATLLAIRLVVGVVALFGLHEIVMALVPVLFMYTPVLLCRIRGVDSWEYPLHLPSFRDGRAWWDAFRTAGLLTLAIAIPFLALYHYWQTEWLCAVWREAKPLLNGFGVRIGRCLPHGFVGELPSQPLQLVAYHLFFVAIAEEMFYRGYLQTRLDEAFPPRWRIFGARLGWGWLLTCALFAAGHTLVAPQWWHFAIFFPSLVFGWLRARTGGILAGAFFHAWCNISVSFLDTAYGVVAP